MGKCKSKITNWADYNQALKKRGSITFWIDDKAIESWYNKEQTGKRGRSNTYSDTAIVTALMLKGLFRLPLRNLEGFLNSIFQLMDIDLKSPDYTCISKRSKSVEVPYRQQSKGAVSHLAIDATGLKVFGEGEWKVRKHGAEKRRTWRKLHLAVDADTHQIISAEVSLDSVHDSEVLPTLLKPLRRKIEQISADGAYDTKGCYEVIEKKNAKPTVNIRKNAGYWNKGHPRNEVVDALRAERLKEWKVESGYHKRSISETAMYRFKQLIGSKLSLRCYNAQVAEALAGVRALNKISTLDLPVRQ